MKIVFLVRSLNYGGAERQLVSLATIFHEQGHSVIVLAFYPGGPLAEELSHGGVRVLSLGKTSRWHIIGFLVRLFRAIRQEKPQIVHGYLDVPNVLTVLLKPFFPRLRVVWGVRGSARDWSRYDGFVRASFRVARLLSRFADLIIVNSQAGSRYYVTKGFPADKMVVVPNGIDSRRFRPDNASGQRIRVEWGASESVRTIGLVGRLDPVKDHPTFLRAAARLAHPKGSVRFVCVGDGPGEYLTELRTLEESLGLGELLVWAGERRDIGAIYNALDVLVSSSSGEGFPNVIGEAMACEIPCVVTDVGDSAWIVGSTGVVVPPGDPGALAEGMQGLLKELDADGRTRGEQARERVVDLFSTDRCAEKTAGALAGLL